MKTQLTLALSASLALLASTSSAQIVSPNGEIAQPSAPTAVAAPVPAGVPVNFVASREEATIAAATGTLNEIMAIPTKGIPAKMLQNAKGVVIVPKVIKGGFVIGVRHGRGVVLTRDAKGNWQAPYFCTLTGGSVGWQAGVQSTDVILVFNTQKSLNGLMSGKFTIGADAAAAAGPVGRQAAAATDARLGAEILSYSRSRGLFAGVSLDGSALMIDGVATNGYYRGSGVAGGTVPASAATLLATLTKYSGGAATTVAPAQLQTTQTPATQPTFVAPRIADTQTTDVKSQLVSADKALKQILDPSWDLYLALPAEIYTTDRHPSRDSINLAAARFETIAASPQYRALSSRAEFKSAHNLLKRYAGSLSQATTGQLLLPPPPAIAPRPAAALPSATPPRY